MRDALSWLALLMLAFILIVVGFQGSAGRVVAVAFVPSLLVISE